MARQATLHHWLFMLTKGKVVKITKNQRSPSSHQPPDNFYTNLDSQRKMNIFNKMNVVLLVKFMIGRLIPSQPRSFVCQRRLRQDVGSQRLWTLDIAGMVETVIFTNKENSLWYMPRKVKSLWYWPMLTKEKTIMVFSHQSKTTTRQRQDKCWTCAFLWCLSHQVRQTRCERHHRNAQVQHLSCRCLVVVLLWCENTITLAMSDVMQFVQTYCLQCNLNLL